LSGGEFHENHALKATLKGFSEVIPMLSQCCHLVSVKSGIRDHFVLLSVYEFCKNLCREGCAFLMGVNEIAFTLA